jgi:hypothetical protein
MNNNICEKCIELKKDIDVLNARLTCVEKEFKKRIIFLENENKELRKRIDILEFDKIKKKNYYCFTRT